MTIHQNYKGILGLIAFCAVIASAYGYYMYNKPVAGLENQKPDYSITPQKLLQDFQTSEETANSNYLNKVIELKGVIAKVEGQNITLEVGDGFAQVICEMKEGASLDNVSKGQKVNVKGLCTGYLMDVILVNCNITP